MASIHDRLKRVRKPRVHITYDVETDGVMGDFTGDSTKPLKPLKDRRFVQIDKDNINEVMRNMSPGLNLKVENTLENDGSEMAVNLEINSMEDFEPASIVDQVEPLKKLMDTRNQLRDLMTKIDRSEELEGIMEKVLQNTDDLDELAKALEVAGDNKGE